MPFLFGRDGEWAAFTEQRGALIEALHQADTACVEMLTAAGKNAGSEADKTLLATGIACRQQVQEIATLCALGYGSGGYRLLRSLYEWVITFAYIAKHPEKCSGFVGYTAVHWHKLLAEGRRRHKGEGVTHEQMAQIDKDYAVVREQYQDECRNCGLKRPQGSWSKVALPDMADDVDPNLGKLYFNAFLRPTFLIHATELGTTYTAEVEREGGVHYYSETQERELALWTIGIARTLLVQVMLTLNSYFELDAHETLAEIGKDIGTEAPAQPRN